jgi:hypothetical protein
LKRYNRSPPEALSAIYFYDFAAAEGLPPAVNRIHKLSFPGEWQEFIGKTYKRVFSLIFFIQHENSLPGANGNAESAAHAFLFINLRQSRERFLAYGSSSTDGDAGIAGYLLKTFQKGFAVIN